MDTAIRRDVTRVPGPDDEGEEDEDLDATGLWQAPPYAALEDDMDLEPDEDERDSEK